MVSYISSVIINEVCLHKTRNYMNIVTSDNSLAWTISDDTSGSGKMKRVTKPKAAPVTHNVLTTHITKYLSDSAKFDH